MVVDLDVKGQRGADFSTRGKVIMFCGLAFCPEAAVISFSQIFHGHIS